MTRETRTWVVSSFIAGVLCALGMTFVLGLLRLAGFLYIDLEMIFGYLVMHTQNDSAWAIGLACHLTLGGVFGVIYGIGFHLFRRAGWGIGACFGLVHWFVAGAIMGRLEARFPIIFMYLPQESPFLPFMGLFTTFCMLILHLAFGAMIGASVSSFRPALATAASEDSPSEKHEPDWRAAA